MRHLRFSLLIFTLLLFIVAGGFASVCAQPSFFAREISLAATVAREDVDALGVNDAGEYLVVWQVDAGHGNTDIWARHVALRPDFRWLDEAFVVASSNKPELAAALAYNPLDDEFLVVYEYAYNENDHDILAQRVAGSADAPTPLIGAALPVGVTTGNEQSPDVAFLAATGQYLVVYEMDADVWARRVARPHQGDDFLGDEFPVAADLGSSESQAAVTAAEEPGYFLVSFTYAFSPDDDDIHAQRVRGERHAGEDLLGSGFSLAYSANREKTSTLAYSSSARAFIILWQEMLPFNTDVRGVWVNADDNSSDPVIGSEFDVAADLVAMEQSPAVDVDDDTGEVAVAFAYAAMAGDWSRPAMLWLNRDPRAAHHLTSAVQVLPEASYDTLSPQLHLSPGATHFLMGFTRRWGVSQEADRDAVLLDTARWGTALPFVSK